MRLSLLPEQAQAIEEANAGLLARAQSVEEKHQAMLSQVTILANLACSSGCSPWLHGTDIKDSLSLQHLAEVPEPA